MPFMVEYVCEYGHRFEELHMGKSDEAPAYLPCKGMMAVPTKAEPSLDDLNVEEDALPPLPVEPTLRKCSRLAERAVSAVRSNMIVRGNHDFLPREKERLTKRSQEYDQSNAGKNAKMEATERRIKNGGLF